MAALEAIVSMRWKHVSRRRLLQFASGVGASLIAGCGADDATPTETPTPTPQSVFRAVEFDGGEMVVQLEEGHDVSRVNLIGPDGELFRQASVAEGVTTVRLEILDIRPLGAGYEHYEPGEYELVGVSDEEPVSTVVELRPELRIVDVRQYRDGEGGTDLGKLVVSVENTGTAPSWVYDIVYRNAPNAQANDELSSDPGVPFLDVPSNPEEAIIQPNGQQEFVGLESAILFDEDRESSCVGEIELAVIVGGAIGEPLQADILTTLSGSEEPATLLGEYTCTEVSVEVIEDGGDRD